MQTMFPQVHDAKLDAAVHTLQYYEPENGPYFGCFSGGKDSVVLKAVAALANVAVDWHYHVTTIDPPEQVAFIKRHHPDVIRDRPKRTFLDWILSKGLPTRTTRWCCQKLKEGVAPRPSRLLMGIRWAESKRRSRTWQTFTHLYPHTRGTAVNPLAHWNDDDVWKFIHDRKLPVCSLYAKGEKRTGCILCPMAGRKKRQQHLERYPTMCNQIRKAAESYWNRRKRQGASGRSYTDFENAEAYWQWWLSDEPMPGHPEPCQGQLELWTSEEFNPQNLDH